VANHIISQHVKSKHKGYLWRANTKVTCESCGKSFSWKDSLFVCSQKQMLHIAVCILQYASLASPNRWLRLTVNFALAKLPVWTTPSPISFAGEARRSPEGKAKPGEASEASRRAKLPIRNMQSVASGCDNDREERIKINIEQTPSLIINNTMYD
jgi:hypothetical protein